MIEPEEYCGDMFVIAVLAVALSFTLMVRS